VPEKSPTITWNDGHVTVLPAVYDKSGYNVCEEVDIPIVKFMAEFPISTSHSSHVAHIPNSMMGQDDVLDLIGRCLSMNKPVVIRGDKRQQYSDELTADFLDKQFAISHHRPVCIHGTQTRFFLHMASLITPIDMMLRSRDHVNMKTTGTIDSFFDAMMDSTRIQCILDLPLAQTSLPERLRYARHISLSFQRLKQHHTEISTMASFMDGTKRRIQFRSYPKFIRRILRLRGGQSFTTPDI
jgi:hypothetical protein